MVLAFIFGFLGGAIHALVGFTNHREKNKAGAKETVELSYLVSTVLSEGILGMFFAYLMYDAGFITVAGYFPQLIIISLTAYVGADLINSGFEILFKKRVDL